MAEIIEHRTPRSQPTRSNAAIWIVVAVAVLVLLAIWAIGWT